MRLIAIKKIREMIREALALVVESEQIVVRRGDKLVIRDDEGNETSLGLVANYPQFSHLGDGQSEIYHGDRKRFGASPWSARRSFRRRY